MLVTKPSTRSACGVVKTSSVGIFGLQVMPFLAVEAPPSQAWPSARPTVRSVPGPREMQGVEALAVEELGALVQRGVMRAPGRRPDRRVSMREAAKMAFAELGDGEILGVAGKHRLRPGQAWDRRRCSS